MDDWFGLQRGLVAVGLLAVVPGCTDADKDKPTSSDPGSTGDSGTTSSSSSSTTAGDTSGDTPTGTGSGTGDGSTGDGTTGDGSTSTSTTGEPTTGGTSTTGETTTGGVEIPPVCQSYGAKLAECYMDPVYAMEAEQYCAMELMTAETFGPDCAPAYEAWLACLSALSCAEFTGPDPCVPEGLALEAACGL
jgi:hypothetical protein